MSTTFSAYDIRGRVGETLSTEQAWNVGKAFAEWLPDEGPIVIAKSPAAHPDIFRGFVEGLLLQGRNVIDAGVGGQETVVDTVTTSNTAGAALISHDDAQNIEVMTLFDTDGATITAETGLADIQQLVEAGNFVPAAVKGTLK